MFAFAELGTNVGRRLVVGPTGVAVADPLPVALVIRDVELLAGVEVPDPDPVTDGAELVGAAVDVDGTVEVVVVVVTTVVLVVFEAGKELETELDVSKETEEEGTPESETEVTLVIEEDEVEKTPEPETVVTLVIEIVVVGQDVVVDETTDPEAEGEVMEDILLEDVTDLVLVLEAPVRELEVEVAEGVH